MTLLAIERVGKIFDPSTGSGRTRALDKVSLAVDEGEFLSVVGPSGCGKSTLLRIVGGLTPPSEGRVTGVPGKGGIGFVFQDATLMPWANAFDNVRLPLRLAGRSRESCRAEVEQALHLVGLDGFERAYPRTLSGGMRMRVSIARALVTKPRLLLLDEPFAALDEITRFKLNDDLMQLWRDQRWTVIFVTHSVFEAVFLSTRVVVMSPRPGRVVADLPIALPQPRAAALRHTPEFARESGKISALLAEAMAA
jgi:NitT/TauT family transport system ATP-binding protein